MSVILEIRKSIYLEEVGDKIQTMTPSKKLQCQRESFGLASVSITVTLGSWEGEEQVLLEHLAALSTETERMTRQDSGHRPLVVSL